MSRWRVRGGSRLLAWCYGLPVEWAWLFRYLRAKRAGARAAQVVVEKRELEGAPTMPIPRIVPGVEPPFVARAAKHAAQVPRRGPGSRLAM